MVSIIKKIIRIFKIFKRSPTKNAVFEKYIPTEIKKRAYTNVRFKNTLDHVALKDGTIFEIKKSNSDTCFVSNIIN